MQISPKVTKLEQNGLEKFNNKYERKYYQKLNHYQLLLPKTNTKLEENVLEQFFNNEYERKYYQKLPN